MISVFFTDQPVKDFASASTSDTGTFRTFFHSLLDRGIYLPPSAFESWFLNNALSTGDLDETVDAVSTWAQR
jgi:glutamate-1-semialdehyde 2,1-aminomutase